MSLDCPSYDKMMFSFRRFKPVSTDAIQKIFLFDIQNVIAFHKDLPQNIQKIFNDLNSQKTLLAEFTRNMINFFELLDGHLLQTVHNYCAKNKTINQDENNNNINTIIHQIVDEINQRFSTENSTKNDFEVYMINGKYIDKEIAISENEKAIDFFKRVVDADNPSYCLTTKNEKLFLFEHYYALYSFTKKISAILDIFFNDPQNKKDKNNYGNKYQTIMNNLKAFFAVQEIK